MNTNRHPWWLTVVILFSSMTPGRCEEQATRTPPVTLPAEAVRTLNAQPAVNRPEDAEASGKFSVDHAVHAAAYNFQAPGIAVVPLPDGRTRLWLSWYQQNNKPGGGTIGQGSIPHCVYAYCDDPFGTAHPVWRRAFYIEPGNVLGDETASDPEVALLPDGRLLCSYITSGPGRTRKRSTYAFLVGNPAASTGALEVGRQHWLEYGVLSQPFNTKSGDVYAVIDEWNVARRFCKLEFASPPDLHVAAERDAVTRVRISDIPWLGHPALTIFFESSMHVVSGGRYRAYRRTKEGVYTTLSEVGGRVWGTEEKWTDHVSVNSRNVFARSPYSGRVIGAVNSPPEGSVYRTDLTLVSSEDEGAPGSFGRALNIEPDFGMRKVASQYPRLAFDKAGYVYCVYRWSDSRAKAPHNGAAIMVARVREDLLADGTATLANVEKRVALIATPFDPKTGTTR
jgi:hypothetical protein